jgi:hypothetical protein
VADAVISHAGTATDPECWADLFRQKVTTNARFWLEQIDAQEAATRSLVSERDNIVKALTWALQLRTAWEPAVDLLLAFHPYVARQGAASDWQRFVEASL